MLQLVTTAWCSKASCCIVIKRYIKPVIWDQPRDLKNAGELQWKICFGGSERVVSQHMVFKHRWSRPGSTTWSFQLTYLKCKCWRFSILGRSVMVTPCNLRLVSVELRARLSLLLAGTGKWPLRFRKSPQPTNGKRVMIASRRKISDVSTKSKCGHSIKASIIPGTLNVSEAMWRRLDKFNRCRFQIIVSWGQRANSFLKLRSLKACGIHP